MRIEINNILKLNQINQAKLNIPKAKVNSYSASLNQDIVEISSKQGQKNYSLSDAKKTVMNDMNKECNADRLAQIKESVKNGTYNIPSEKIAASILSGEGIKI